MTFRLHSMVAALLFPALLCAQTSKPAAKSPSSKSATASATSGSYAAISTPMKQRGEKVFELFNSGQTGAMWAMFSEGLKKRSGSEEKFAAASKSLREHLGSETKVVNEVVTPTLMSNGTIYSRLSEFNKAQVEVITTIGLNEQGQVDGFQIGPSRTPSQGRFGGYKDTTKLKLPFSGDWVVDQGGRSAFLNGNFLSDEQRFAIDFILVKGGKVYSGDGTDSSNYYCFGQPVLSPADGVVVDVEDGYLDNPPGKPASDSPRGNMILISHGNAEFSLMDHLKQNSIKFKKGDKVKQGEAVAECGNSGPSPVPHIHYQLQNSGGLPLPDSLPAQFVNYMADGKLVDVGEPVRGQTVSNAPAGTASQPLSTNQAADKTPPGSR
jgi:murein DD-endopeptidase MepM/ murein hydrolase activator NlpD